jgi:hypothetical protein
MKFQRVVLENKQTKSLICIDFGWLLSGQVKESVDKLKASYPECRVLRKFAITEGELNNGQSQRILQ